MQSLPLEDTGRKPPRTWLSQWVSLSKGTSVEGTRQDDTGHFLCHLRKLKAKGNLSSSSKTVLGESRGFVSGVEVQLRGKNKEKAG